MANKKKVRNEIAHKVAQLLFEEGFNDLTVTKRKASKYFKLTSASNLPSNEEIKKAMKDYQSIFSHNNENSNLNNFRLSALSLMIELKQFSPRLAGDLIDDVIPKYPVIKLLIDFDFEKELNFFLINKKIPFKLKGKNYILQDCPIQTEIIMSSRLSNNKTLNLVSLKKLTEI